MGLVNLTCYNVSMATLDSTALRDFFVQFTDGFTPELAEYFVSTKPKAELQARIDELAGKANEGELTDAERSEYDTYIEAMDLIALLRVKSMKKVDSNPPR